jgi:hypothetical protein
MYYCGISDGPALTSAATTNAAFIEWYYLIEVATIATGSVPLKFTWTASGNWIYNNYVANGGAYINPITGVGIPMLNPSNHNV